MTEPPDWDIDPDIEKAFSDSKPSVGVGMVPNVLLPNKKSPNFEFREDVGSDKIVYTIYGNKGVGKTVFSYALPGKKYVLSFDKKSVLPKKFLFQNDGNIHVLDAILYWDKEHTKMVPSSVTTYEYIMFLLDNIAKDGCDYIIFDGLEVLMTICEMKMRNDFKITAFGGVANLNVWKSRKSDLYAIHNKALRIAKKGLIYTTYTTKNEIIRDGTVILKTDMPKWTDVIMFETDVVINVQNEMDKDGFKVVAKINTSKIPTFRTGEEIDITGMEKLKQNVTKRFG